MKRVLIVGGGNSAAEAALALSDVGAAVTLAVRRPSLDLVASEVSNQRAAIKPWVREPLEQAISSGAIRLLTSAHVVHVSTDSALLEISGGRQGMAAGVLEVACDRVFALIGGDPDPELLQNAGAVIAADGRPVYDPETYETTVPGLFVAGHLTRERHIKNAIRTAQRIVEYIGSHIVDCALANQ